VSQGFQPIVNRHRCTPQRLKAHSLGRLNGTAKAVALPET
jgi:hypothetical protein